MGCRSHNTQRSVENDWRNAASEVRLSNAVPVMWRSEQQMQEGEMRRLCLCRWYAAQGGRQEIQAGTQSRQIPSPGAYSPPQYKSGRKLKGFSLLEGRDIVPFNRFSPLYGVESLPELDSKY